MENCPLGENKDYCTLITQTLLEILDPVVSELSVS